MTEIEMAAGMLVDRIVGRGIANASGDRVVDLVLRAIGAHPAVRQLRFAVAQRRVVDGVTHAHVVQALWEAVTQDPRLAQALSAELRAGEHAAGSTTGMRNIHAGSSRNVVMARDIDGGVHIGARVNRDVDIILQSEQKKFVLTEQTGSLSIMVSGRSTEPRRVALRAHGMPHGTWVIVPPVVPVSRDRPGQAEIQLHRGATSPEASKYDLRIVGEDAGGPGGDLWESDTKAIVVPAAPGVECGRLAPGSRISAAGTYRVSLTLHNTGNTRLAPTITPYSLDGETTVRHALREDAVRIVHTGQRTMPPNGDTAYDIAITLPSRGLLDRCWRVPLVIDPRRDDLAPVKQDRQVVQYGLLSAMAERLGQATGRPPLPQHALAAAVVGTVLVLVVFLITVAVQSSGSSVSAAGATPRPTSPATATSTPATTTPAPTTMTSTTATSADRPPSPTDVVRSYYAAVNRRDFRGAWQLAKGMLRDASYDDWVRGYANTIKVTVTVESASGREVCVRLTALETGQKTNSYSGCYVVVDGVIDSGYMELEPAQPTTTR